MRVAPLAAIAALAACQAPPDPARQAREDARAVAIVEAAQHIHPPPVAFTPEAFGESDLSRLRLAGPACRFLPGPAREARPILIVNGERALLRAAGRDVTFAADAGSPALVPAVRAHYVGKAHALVLARADGDGSRPGEDRVGWSAVLTIRDPWDQIVYTAAGRLVC